MAQRPDGVTIYTHYPTTDSECSGDYYDVEVMAFLNKKPIYAQQYGDYYHEKGHDRAQGFVDCLTTVWPKLPVLRINLHDREEM